MMPVQRMTWVSRKEKSSILSTTRTFKAEQFDSQTFLTTNRPQKLTIFLFLPVASLSVVLFLSHFLSPHLSDISFSVPCRSTARVTGGRLALWTQGTLGTFPVIMWPLWTPYKLRSELHINMPFHEFTITLYTSFKIYFFGSMQVVFWEDGPEGCRTTVVGTK